MSNKDIRILKKIQQRVYDEEVIEYINKSLDWYEKHSEEILNKNIIGDDEL